MNFIQKHKSIKWGFIAGCCSCLFYNILWAISPELFAKGSLLTLPLFFFIILGIYYGIRKKQLNRQLDLGNIIIPIFSVFLIGYLVNTIYFLVFALLIEPSIPQFLMEHKRKDILELLQAGQVDKTEFQAFENSVQRSGPSGLLKWQSVSGLFIITPIAFFISIISLFLYSTKLNPFQN